MEKLSWIFDGIGTAVISGIIGLLFGGIAGYKVGVNKRNKVRGYKTT